jgi:hypothetical protein
MKNFELIDALPSVFGIVGLLGFLLEMQIIDGSVYNSYYIGPIGALCEYGGLALCLVTSIGSVRRIKRKKGNGFLLKLNLSWAAVAALILLIWGVLQAIWDASFRL